MARMTKAQLKMIALEFDLSELADIPEPPKRSDKLTGEEIFAGQCRAFGLPNTQSQYKFETELRSAKSNRLRQWKFDFAWPQYWLAVEIDGIIMRQVRGEWIIGGRHATAQGMRDDNEKINRAIELGWSVLRYLEDEVKPGRAINQVMKILAQRGWKR